MFELRVEGDDDVHAIAALLKRHGVDTDKSSRKFNIIPAGSDRKLLDSVQTSILASKGQPVGFVVDADVDLAARWNSIRDRLAGVGASCPLLPDAIGTIVDVVRFKTKVGFWLMPDNSNQGMLEDFLQNLIDSGDGLLSVAKQATQMAIECDRRFSERHDSKAVLHAWLAWQEKPGLPFGTAITAEAFRHDSPEALAFVDWFRRLSGIS